MTTSIGINDILKRMSSKLEEAAHAPDTFQRSRLIALSGPPSGEPTQQIVTTDQHSMKFLDAESIVRNSRRIQDAVHDAIQRQRQQNLYDVSRAQSRRNVSLTTQTDASSFPPTGSTEEDTHYYRTPPLTYAKSLNIVSPVLAPKPSTAHPELQQSRGLIDSSVPFRLDEHAGNETVRKTAESVPRNYMGECIPLNCGYSNQAESYLTVRCVYKAFQFSS